MSRGLGSVQRRILAVLEGETDEVLDTREVIARAYAVGPDHLTPSQVSGGRRALALLERAGRIGSPTTRRERVRLRRWGTPSVVEAYEARVAREIAAAVDGHVARRKVE